MAVTQIADVVVPTEFTQYVVMNSVEKTALREAGVATRNGAIESQLHAGADAFSIPHWLDLANDEADISNDDPTDLSVPHKLGSGKQLVRKSFLHSSWSAMNLASELSGSDAISRIRNRVIEFVPDSQGGLIRTYRGLAVIVDDGLPVAAGEYTSVLFGSGAVGYGLSAPRIAAGTEIENLPSAGQGGGQQILHSRINLAVHPLGFAWLEGSVAAESPSIAELALAANWNRVAAERKQVPLAFLIARAAAA